MSGLIAPRVVRATPYQRGCVTLPDGSIRSETDDEFRLHLMAQLRRDADAVVGPTIEVLEEHDVLEGQAQVILDWILLELSR